MIYKHISEILAPLKILQNSVKDLLYCRSVYTHIQTHIICEWNWKPKSQVNLTTSGNGKLYNKWYGRAP